MSINVTLNVTEIQRFCMHDGPGVRTTVFLKGCPLRCAWCHNPETQSPKSELLFYPNKCIGCAACASVCPNHAHAIEKSHTLNRDQCAACFSCANICPTGALEVCGKKMTVDEILSIVQKDKAFYGKAGGVTLSGGEPLLQASAVELLKACKQKGFSTAVETCGFADPAVLQKALPFVDLFLWDLKDTNPDRHLRYTGVSNTRILENLAMISEKGATVRLRCILIGGINTEPTHYKKIAETASGIPNLDGVELIPYHAYGGAKATFLGLQDNGNADWIPDALQMQCAKDLLEKKGIKLLRA